MLPLLLDMRGIRDLNELVAGISFPLPFWNQNQGNIKKAINEMLKTENEAKQLWILLETLLSKTHADLARAYSEIQDLKEVLIKKANESFELAMEGYKEGKFEYLEVLEAKRTLFDIQERYINL